MTRTIKICLIFVLIVAINLSLPTFLNLKNINNESSANNLIVNNETINNPANENEQEITFSKLDQIKAKFLNSANNFYVLLNRFEDLYIFAYFQENLKFKEQLLNSSTPKDYFSATFTLNQAIQEIKKIITANSSHLNINLLLNDDNCTNILNSVYQHFLILTTLI